MRRRPTTPRWPAGRPRTAPTEPEAFADPGAPLRQQARRILGQARSARDAAAASAADAIRRATDLAPAEPSLASQLASDVIDGLQVANLADLVRGRDRRRHRRPGRFARSLDPLDQWNLEHPAEYVAGLSGTAAGLANDVINPQDLVKGLVGTGLGQRPGAPLGRLVPNVALAVGTDGGGTAADAGPASPSAAALGSERGRGRGRAGRPGRRSRRRGTSAG